MPSGGLESFREKALRTPKTFAKMNHSYLERRPEEALRFLLALLSPKLLSKVLEGVIGETFSKKFPLKIALRIALKKSFGVGAFLIPVTRGSSLVMRGKKPKRADIVENSRCEARENMVF